MAAKKKEGAFELSFGADVSQANKAIRAKHSRESIREVSSHHGPRKYGAFCKQKGV